MSTATKPVKKSYEMDMCSGSLFKKMVSFALPVMFSGVLQLLFNAADVVVVGRFAGDDCLAAVGSVGSLVALLTNLFVGLSIGTNVLAARLYGAKKNEELSRVVHTSMLLSLFSGIILTVIGVVAAEKILILMQTPEKILPLSTLYLRIYFLGMTSTMVYNFGSAILRAVGDTRRPLYYLSISGVINVCLNLVLVIVFHLNVAGVAIATAVSQTVSAVLVVNCLMRSQSGIRLDLKKLCIKKKIFLQVLRIGLPAGFQGMVFSFSNMIIQSSVNSFGETVVAGNSAAANLEGFVYIALNAFYQTTLSFVSQNYGAGNHKRITRAVLLGEGMVICCGLLLGLLGFFFGDSLLTIYSSSSAVIAVGVRRLSIICVTYFLCGAMDVMVGALRGIGYSVLPMMISLIGVCGVRVLWIFTVFRIERFHTLETVYLSYPITWSISITVLTVSFIIARRRMIKKAKSNPDAG